MKILAVLERIAREKEGFIRHCLKAVVASVEELVPSITTTLCFELRKVATNNSKTKPSPQVIKTFKEQFQNFPIIVHLITSSLFRLKIFVPQFVEDLSSVLQNAEYLNAIEPEFTSQMLLILEVISQVLMMKMTNDDVESKHDFDTKRVCCQLFDACVVGIIVWI